MPIVLTDITLPSGITFVGETYAAPPGQAQYTTPGTYSWTAPLGVTSVSVVCIGGGGSGGSSGGGNGPGGGGNEGTTGNGGNYGAGGAVRLIWAGGSGLTRAFPTTNTGNL